MDTIIKHQLELSSEDDNYMKLRIGDLHAIYTDNYKYIEYSDPIALVMHSEYNGYCTLCKVQNTVFNDTYVVQLNPLYDEFGHKILVRYDHDVLFAVIDIENKNEYECHDDNTKIYIRIPKHGCSIGLDNLK